MNIEKLTRAEKNKIMEMWENGNSGEEIEKELSIDKTLIDDHIASFYRKEARKSRNSKPIPVHQQGFSSWVDEILFQTYYNILEIKK